MYNIENKEQQKDTGKLRKTSKLNRKTKTMTTILKENQKTSRTKFLYFFVICNLSKQ